MRLEVMTDILEENNRQAEENRRLWESQVVLNLLGSPGSGKTTLLEATLQKLPQIIRPAVIEGDLFTDKDASRIERLGVPCVQLNTRGGCHLTASMVYDAAQKLPLDSVNLLIVENVGNLVCPAEFDLGEDARAVVLSVAEGADKPKKYPLIFKEAEAVLITKTDLLPYTDFDLEAARSDLLALNPRQKVLPLSAKTKEGLDSWLEWIQKWMQKKVAS